MSERYEGRLNDSEWKEEKKKESVQCGSPCRRDVTPKTLWIPSDNDNSNEF